MKVTIIETNESQELNIIDPKTGTNWANDLLGNHNALPEYNDETDSYHMTQEDYNWWDSLINKYQAADDRYCELRQTLPASEVEEMERVIQEVNCDLEDYPRFLSQVCDEAEGI